MKKLLSVLSYFAILFALNSPSNGDIVVTTSSSGTSPSASSTDLAQTQFSSSSATGGNNIAANQGFIFNGSVGTTGSGTGTNGTTQVPTADDNNTITLNLDTSVNVLGYDITGIDTIFGWNPASNGRSNQGYSIELGFVGGGTATLVSANHWEPNNPSSYWTVVSFAENGGGTLFSNTVDLNGSGPTADTSVLASGVNSITWDIANPARAGGVVVLREFDVFGVATVPEPSSALAMLGLLVGAAFKRRRS